MYSPRLRFSEERTLEESATRGGVGSHDSTSDTTRAQVRANGRETDRCSCNKIQSFLRTQVYVLD